MTIANMRKHCDYLTDSQLSLLPEMPPYNWFLSVRSQAVSLDGLKGSWRYPTIRIQCTFARWSDLIHLVDFPPSEISLLVRKWICLLFSTRSDGFYHELSMKPSSILDSRNLRPDGKWGEPEGFIDQNGKRKKYSADLPFLFPKRPKSLESAK